MRPDPRDQHCLTPSLQTRGTYVLGGSKFYVPGTRPSGRRFPPAIPMDRPWRWPGAPPTSFAGRLETSGANDIIEPRHTVGADGPYWQALAEGRLELPRCEGCNRWHRPEEPRVGKECVCT